MADKLGLGNETRELKLGPSFSNGKASSFHTIRYDFKPASVDLSKMATVDVRNGNEVMVTVPHLDGAGTSHTVFRGSQRPYQKECVLIFDRATGEITLEKLTCNIQVKKTRMESSQKPALFNQNSRSADVLHNTQRKLSANNQRTSNKKKTSPKPQQLPTSLTGCIPKHSPLHASPSYPSRSPPRAPYRSPQNIPLPTASSLPVISVDESGEVFPGMTSRFTAQSEMTRPQHSPHLETRDEENTGALPMSTDTSSDSFSSESDSEEESKPIKYGNGHINGATSPALTLQDNLLKEDLQLSESGSDSD